MIQIRRRWPILATVVAALAYGANHYQLAGIEHLRLEPRPEPPAPTGGYLPGWGTNWVMVPAASDSVPSTTMGPYASSPPSPNSGVPSWKEKLTLGEKLAVWQESHSNSAERTSVDAADALSIGSSFPVSSPIPLPAGFEPSNDVLPETLPRLAGSMAGDALPSTTTAPTVAPAPIQAPVAPPGAASTVPLGNMAAVDSVPSDAPLSDGDGQAGARGSRVMRVASFNVRSLGPAKMAKPHITEALVTMIRQYDVIALQEIQSSRDDLLPMILDRLNQSGRQFDYLIGPRVGRTPPHHQFAIVFDTERLETDRYQLYTVDDPQDLLSYEPLVAWFRCKGVPPEEAFTFSLATVRLDDQFADSERTILPGLIDAIQRDGRGEDDWILAGDFGGGISQLTSLDNKEVRFAIRDLPTDVAGTRMLDTICFSARATTEFTGRAGAFDFLRQYNLSIERTLEISDHLPVWAEFSVIEGAEPGRIAPLDPQAVY